MIMSEHTPIPWTVAYEDRFYGHHGAATICDSTPKPIELNEANVAFIVAAVNAYIEPTPFAAVPAPSGATAQPD
jgi:hypothetical protein